MRRAQAYTPFVQPNEQAGKTVRLPMDAPSLASRSHLGDKGRYGEDIRGTLGVVVPIHSPGDSGRDAVRGGSKVVTGGTVRGYITSNNSIRPSLLVARNLFSPTSHPSDSARVAASGRVPPAAIRPSKDITMPPKMGKRGTGGSYYVPAPQVTPTFLSSADWLHKRVTGK